MIRASITAAAILLAGILAGCAKNKNQSFVDAPVVYDQELHKGDRTDLSYVKAPVRDVIAQMQDKFNCRIKLSTAAEGLIAAGDPRITAQVESLPVGLAFAVLRTELEFKGFVLIAQGNALGRPAYVLDRGMLRELTVPETAAKAPAKSGSDF